MGQCFELKDVFPLVEEVIQQLCRLVGEAEHDAIVAELMKHEQASVLLGLAVRRCPKQNREWIAGNMVAWLSRYYTEGRIGDFAARFKRREHKGSWAYSER